jgi:NAD(P)-dependent dehydrogenase (short-subunit alcohol dehydrogenase family)
MPRLRNKRILITGASSGIGLAAVERFAREGADLALAARGEAALAEAAAVAREHGVAAHAFAADLADREAATATVEAAVEALGGLDVVVSNAGAVSFGHFLEVDPDDFDRTVAVTFTSAVNVIRAALPELRATRGVIVATSSLMARMPLPAFSSYTAAKHALRGFLTTLQVEEREQRSGVRVAMVSPGPVDTPIYDRATSATGRQPGVLPDAYHPDEIAEALVEAALSPRHDHIVGGESRFAARLYRHVRPAGELLLVAVDRWFRTGTLRAEQPGSLWEPLPAARLSGGLPARSDGDLMAFAGHLAGAAARAVRTAPGLLRPVPEEVRPQRSESSSRSMPATGMATQSGRLLSS